MSHCIVLACIENPRVPSPGKHCRAFPTLYYRLVRQPNENPHLETRSRSPGRSRRNRVAIIWSSISTATVRTGSAEKSTGKKNHAPCRPVRALSSGDMSRTAATAQATISAGSTGSTWVRPQDRCLSSRRVITPKRQIRASNSWASGIPSRQPD